MGADSNSSKASPEHMARPVRHSGISGPQIAHLRRRERWSQTDLANRLGVHRVTLARWEACLGDPPFGVAEQLMELFKVDHTILFRPPEEHEEDVDSLVRIRDPRLRRIPLAKLQKFTKHALKASGLTLRQLARRVQELTVQRLQDLLDGQKPTVYEIQLLKDRLGALFSPVSSMKKSIQAPTGEGRDASMLIPDAAKASQLVRCLWILKLLSEESLHFSELALMFQVSERQIQRNVRTLREVGVVIETTPRGYALHGQWSLPL